MARGGIPDNLKLLHEGEEELRTKAVTLIEADPRLAFHLHMTEVTMDVVDVFRQFDTEDEDLKVIQMLGLRLFNAFASR